MKQFQVSTNCRQILVADRSLYPEESLELSQEILMDEDQSLEGLVVLRLRSHAAARIMSCGPDDPEPEFTGFLLFEKLTSISIPSLHVGIYSWPWKLEVEYDIGTRDCEVLLQGFAIYERSNEVDYYYLRVGPKQGLKKKVNYDFS